MNLFRAIQHRSDPTISMDQLVEQFKYLNTFYPVALRQTLTGNQEHIEESFEGYVQGLYKSNGVVFAVEGARLRLFQQARFIWRAIGSRPTQRLFGNRDLALLENPWPNGNTQDLLARVIQDADMSGNAFFVRRPGPRLKRLRPDWVTIVLGSPDGADPGMRAGDIDAEVIGYGYQPGGPGSGRQPVALDVDDVVHFAPYPDPLYSFRGMSWITPVLREIMGDSAATSHKLKFFENGATANMIVTLDPDLSVDDFNKWVDIFEGDHAGVLNAYKTIYLGGGADTKVVGADMHQMDFKTVQGAGETRIAAAGGVPPVVVGLSEGLQAATYSNYGQARRSLADVTMHPLWMNVAGSFEKVVRVPRDAELWYDFRGIPFLKEDQKDAIEIQKARASTHQILLNAGYTPESVIAAVEADDFSLLKHTGLYSVQLQPPMPEGSPPAADQAGRSLAELIKPFLKDIGGN